MTYPANSNGNLTTMNLPKGTGQTTPRHRRIGYDSLGRRINATLPAPSSGTSAPTIGRGYDRLDQLRSVTDPQALSTTYGVSGLRNTTALSSPDTGTAPEPRTTPTAALPAAPIRAARCSPTSTTISVGWARIVI